MLKNGLYNVVGAVVRLGLNLLTIPLLIRFLGVEEYGLWMLVSAVIGLISLAEAGLAFSTTIFVSRDLAAHDHVGVSETVSITGAAILSLATIALIIMWLGASSIVLLFPSLSSAQQASTVSALRLAGFVIWFRLPQQVLVGIEQAYQRYDLLNLINTIQTIGLTLGLLAVSWYGGQIVGLMQCQVVVGIIALVIHLYTCGYLLRYVGLRPVWNIKKGREVGRYSILTWLTVLGSTLFTQMDRLIVGALLGPVPLGIYSAITNVAAQINTFSALPVQPLLPSLSSRIVTEGHAQSPALVHQVKQSLQINGVVALGLGATLFSFSSFITRLLMPEVYSGDVIRLFQVAIIIYSIYSLNAVGYFILFAVKAIKTCMIIQLCSGIFALTLIAVGASYFGIAGAIIGNIGYNTVWLLTVYGMRQLNVPARQWSKWLIFPILWFLFVIVSNYLLRGLDDALLICLFLAQSMFIVGWFYRLYGASMFFIMKRAAR